jgi:acetylornithine deacetylase
MTVETTLLDLVAIDSVSSRSNTEIISYLESRCLARGLECKRFRHDGNGVEKINLLAFTPDQSIAPFPTHRDSAGALQIELALVGHTDTVPYDPTWTEALQLTAKDGKLFGRGACDTKAFIAATLAAIESVDLSQLKKPLALVFTADEEIGCLGAKRLAETRPFAAQYAIVGEPTSLQPMRAGKGYCLAEITVRGREAHSAYPGLGASAIFRAARLIERIERIAEELKSDERAGFDPPHTTLNVGIINGGSAKNVIAGECHFTVEWRPIPGQQTDHVLNMIEQAVTDLQQHDSDFVCQIDAARADESFETRADSPLTRFLEQASGNASGTVAFGTEAPSMIALGADAVVFGPGDIRVAHRTGEFVPADQLHECVNILRRAVERFCL